MEVALNPQDEVIQCAEIIAGIKHAALDNEERISLQQQISSLPLGSPIPIKALRGKVGQRTTCYRKELTNSDLKDGQSRLMFGKVFASTQILPLLRKNEDPEMGVEVNVYDYDGKKYKMEFKGWKSFVLTKATWKDFYRGHGLTYPRDGVRLWAFRHLRTDRLCFAIICEDLTLPPGHKDRFW